jgi:hypothetical protein
MNVNWLIIISNIGFASISTILCLLGWNTLKTIKYLHVDKSFWIPIFLSGLLFAISSLITILNDIVLSLTAAFEIEQITQLIALCALSIGIYSYSKTIKRNIPEKYVIPEDISTQKSKNESHVAPTISIDSLKGPANNSRTDDSSKCNHQLGYLSTFPTNSSLPEECMSYNKVIECKQS